MKRVLAVGLALAISVALVPSASAAKSLKVKATGWNVYDGVGTAPYYPPGSTYTRCVNNPDTPPVIALGARFDIFNKSVPTGSKLILNGPGKLHIVYTTKGKVPAGKGWRYKFFASQGGRDHFGPGTYTFRLKVGKTTKASEFIKLVDDGSC